MSGLESIALAIASLEEDDAALGVEGDAHRLATGAHHQLTLRIKR